MANIGSTIITSNCNHGLNEEDCIRIHIPKRTRLINLLIKPRVTYISSDIRNSSFEIKNRRMTWREWRGEMHQLIMDFIDDEVESYEREIIY